tara:strand:+ start:2450 stop:2887 length:438 start_codon:yes stop_codon:yes gene_type:complete
MAPTQAMCSSFKQELLQGLHNFTASSGNAFKMSLHTSSSSIGAATTAYASSGIAEVANGNGYTSGGIALTEVTPTLDGTTAITDFGDASFTSATITARGALIYNDTNADRAVAVLDFGSDKTSTAGTFTVQFPTADASNAIIRIA